MSIAPDYDPAKAASGPLVMAAAQNSAARERVADPETTADAAADRRTAALAAWLRAAPAVPASVGATGRAAAVPGPGLLRAVAVLIGEHTSFDAADPAWADRDRLLASPELQGVLHGILALCGHADEAGGSAWPERQPGRVASACCLGWAVGMALAERTLAGRFGRSLVDHRTWLLAGPSELSDGASHEAASLAGQLRLERLTVLWDATQEPLVDDMLRRFAAYGWTARAVAAGEPAALDAALSSARRSRKPTLIACRSGQDEGASAAAHAPGGDEWVSVGAACASVRRGWLKRLAHHPRRADFERVRAATAPDGIDAVFARLRAEFSDSREPLPTCAASARVLEALMPLMPELAGATADVRPGNAGDPVPAFRNGAAFGRWLQLGAREHGLAAAMDGMAVHGGVLPVGVTVRAPGEALYPALWRAARLGLRLVHVLSADPAEVGEAGDQLASLRAIPNLLVLEPADAMETVECWEVALRRTGGPSLLVVSREARPALRSAAAQNCSEHGGYVLAEAQGPRRAALIAAGSAVALAMSVRARLAAERIYVAVVSLPCWALFARADAAYQAQVLGDAPRFGLDPGAGFGWERWLGEQGTFIGASGEAQSSGGLPLDADAIAGMIRERLSG